MTTNLDEQSVTHVKISLQKRLTELFKNKKLLIPLLFLIILLSLVTGFLVLKEDKDLIPSQLRKNRAQLPLVNFPKPFESGYFTALLSPRVLATIGDLEITGDSNPYTFKMPLDGHVARSILLKNTGNQEVFVEYKATITIPNFDETMFINHPQPARLYLDPGETYPIRLVYSPAPGSIGKTGMKVSAPMTLELSQSTKSRRGESYKLTLDNTVEVVGEDGPAYKELSSNATIKGIVKDASSGKPLKNVPVNVFSGPSSRDVVTDSNGSFTAPVYAFNLTGTPHWSEFVLSVNSPEKRFLDDYAHTMRAVTVEEGETEEVEILLAKALEKADFAVKSTLDIGLQAYTFDASSDGNIFATVPFHSALPPQEIEPLAYLSVFDSNGNLLFKHHIRSESPTVDVSEDGSLIATTVKRAAIGRPEEFGGDAIVLDKKGNVVFTFSPPETRFWWGNISEPIAAVQLTKDNKLLAAGDTFGRLFLVDIVSGDVVWETFTRGQVRRLWFDEGNESKLFASSGDGYLRAFDAKGKLVWKTFVDAWLTDMDVSDNYIVTTSKANRAPIHLIDKENGKTVWSYPVEQRGADVFISADESYVFYGTQIGGVGTVLKSAIFDISGNPLFNMIPSAGAAAATSDSKYIAVKNDQSVYLYNRDGDILWTESLVSSGDGFAGGGNSFLYISPDGKKIITAMPSREDRLKGVVYFLEGGVAKGKPEIMSQPKGEGGNPPQPPPDTIQPSKDEAPPQGVSNKLCGDNVCDTAESANPNLCPADCANN